MKKQSKKSLHRGKAPRRSPAFASSNRTNSKLELEVSSLEGWFSTKAEHCGEVESFWAQGGPAEHFCSHRAGYDARADVATPGGKHPKQAGCPPTAAGLKKPSCQRQTGVQKDGAVHGTELRADLPHTQEHVTPKPLKARATWPDPHSDACKGVSHNLMAEQYRKVQRCVLISHVNLTELWLHR